MSKCARAEAKGGSRPVFKKEEAIRVRLGIDHTPTTSDIVTIPRIALEVVGWTLAQALTGGTSDRVHTEGNARGPGYCWT